MTRRDVPAVVAAVIIGAGLGAVIGLWLPVSRPTLRLSPEVLDAWRKAATVEGTPAAPAGPPAPAVRPCPDAALERAYRETLIRSGVFGRIEHGAP